MATPSLHSFPPLFFFFFFFFILFACSTLTQSKKSTYIVHVSQSHKPATFLSTHDWYSSILNSLSSTSNTSIKSNPNILYTYSHAATGFAAHISATHATRLRRLPFVLSVVPDQIVELTTTHTPSFLGLSDEEGLWPETSYGSDIIVGVVDSGIWPKSVSFHDQGFGSVPENWKGYCEGGPDFPASFCNKKLIGARFFYKGYEIMNGPLKWNKSAMDASGHGTHCASIAAGSAVRNAGYYEYALGEARGVAVLARVAVYKVFWGPSSQGTLADILYGIEQAIEDGVHVLSLSLSTVGPSLDYFEDPIAVASFRATQRGIVVSAAASNDGYYGSFTVKNVSPWMLTVAASTVDRQFSAQVQLGNGRVMTGSTLSYFSKTNYNSTGYYLLITGEAAGSSLCLAGKLVSSRVTGKIIICEMDETTDPVTKSFVAQQAGAAGMILVNYASLGEDLILSPFIIPAITVTHTDGDYIKSYAISTAFPSASIVFKGAVIGPSPSAPRLATFSSRGPNKITPEILKPDVTAPGVNILAAWTNAVGPSRLVIDTRRVHYNIISGTSMSCPHVSGLCALLRKAHPTWSPASIKSAIMTTSYIHDNAGNNLLELSTGKQSSPFAYGSGHVDPEKAVDPGLVYDLDTDDYVAFLCSIGYDRNKIATFVQNSSTIDYCSQTKSLSNPGDLNYPSFSVVFNSPYDTVRYTRTVKNVGNSVDTVYRVRVSAPTYVQVNVSPTTLVFSADKKTLSYTISFNSVAPIEIPTNGMESFGSVEWSDQSHRVRSPIAAYWPYNGVQQEALLTTI